MPGHSRGPRPQPDYSVGFSDEAFSQDQLAKLFANSEGTPTPGSPYLGSYWIYFPFLACEAACGDVQIADRQNAHAAGIAVMGIVELFKRVEREAELDRESSLFRLLSTSPRSGSTAITRSLSTGKRQSIDIPFKLSRSFHNSRAQGATLQPGSSRTSTISGCRSTLRGFAPSSIYCRHRALLKFLCGPTSHFHRPGRPSSCIIERTSPGYSQLVSQW
ncbi:hypothetical protein VTN96DRAFT_4335 [Rasamsonia emersonii]